MRKDDIENFLRYWHRLETELKETADSPIGFLETFAEFLNFEISDSFETDLFSYISVKHRGLFIFGDSEEALFFFVKNESEETALDIYSSLKSVVYAKGMSNQPSAILVIKSTQTFINYCQESPLEFVLLFKKKIALILKNKKPRWAFSLSLKESSSVTVVNPYKTAGPVVGSMFYGRKSELKKMTNLIPVEGERTSFALIGARKSGKSSLLLTLKNIFEKKNGVAVHYIDCFTYRTAHRVMFEIATRLQPRAALRWNPEKFAHFLSLMRKKKEYIILLDEIDEAAKDDIISHNQLFGSLAGAFNFRIILVGHIKLREVIRSPRTPLYNMVERIDLSGLDRSSGKSLIIEPLIELGFKLKDPNKITDYILNQSAGRPVIIQLYCRELLNRAWNDNTNEITIDDVKEVEKARTFREDTLDAFLIDIPPLSRLIALIMLEHQENTIISEQFLFEEIKRNLPNYRISEVIDAIYLLEDPGIIRRQNKILLFAYPAFPRLISELHDIHFLKSEMLKELAYE